MLETVQRLSSFGQWKLDLSILGIIGIVMCDQLEPTNNKQDFNFTPAYHATEPWLRDQINNYYYEYFDKVRKEEQRRE